MTAGIEPHEFFAVRQLNHRRSQSKLKKTLRACSNLALSIFPEHETYFERVSEVQRLVDQLPEPNKRMLEMLMSHLEKVDNITCAMLS